MPGTSLDPDQIEVEAEFYFIQEDESPSLDSVQYSLMDTMSRHGYVPLNKGQRVWEYILQREEPQPSFRYHLKDRLGLASRSERQAKNHLEKLRGTRSNHPFRFKFRFIPTAWENGDEGYVIEVECIPALRDKIDQLEGDFEDENPKSAVRTCKSELRDIATEVGFSTLQEPFSRAENYKSTLNSHLRKQLQEYKYGSYVTHFADDADEALRYSLIRPAICAYVHGIEWSIICFLEEERGLDLVDEEGYGDGDLFKELIGRIEDAGEVSQTTSDALNQIKTERIWMAHHKKGKVSEIEVRRVKKRFEILLEELFL